MGCRGFLEAIEEGAIYDFLVVPARQAKFDKNPYQTRHLPLFSRNSVTSGRKSAQSRTCGSGIGVGCSANFTGSPSKAATRAIFRKSWAGFGKAHRCQRQSATLTSIRIVCLRCARGTARLTKGFTRFLIR